MSNKIIKIMTTDTVLISGLILTVLLITVGSTYKEGSKEQHLTNKEKQEREKIADPLLITGSIIGFIVIVFGVIKYIMFKNTTSSSQ
jgi:hypothetical protein